MALGKQAKLLSPQQQVAVLSFIEATRNPVRNRVIFLLSVKAGLRAKEIAQLSWGMVTNSEKEIDEVISLEDCASKGRSGGKIWMNKELKRALADLKDLNAVFSAADPVITTERSRSTTPQVIVNMFSSWYQQLGFNGCSSHSGRRTFITNAARKISTVGGSMRDVQLLARHSSLNMTMRYIEGDAEAMRKVVQII